MIADESLGSLSDVGEVLDVVRSPPLLIGLALTERLLWPRWKAAGIRMLSMFFGPTNAHEGNADVVMPRK